MQFGFAWPVRHRRTCIVVRPAFYCRRSPVNRTHAIRHIRGPRGCRRGQLLYRKHYHNPSGDAHIGKRHCTIFSTDLLTNNRPVQYALFPVSRDRDDTAIRLLYRTTPPVPRTDRVFRRRRRSLLLLLLLCAVASSWGMFSVRRDRVRITILLRCYYKQRRSDK